MRRRFIGVLFSACLAVLVTAAMAQVFTSPSDAKRDKRSPDSKRDTKLDDMKDKYDPSGLKAGVTTTRDTTETKATEQGIEGVLTVEASSNNDETKPSPETPLRVTKTIVTTGPKPEHSADIDVLTINRVGQDLRTPLPVPPGPPGTAYYGYVMSAPAQSGVNELVEKWKRCQDKADRVKTEQSIQTVLKEQFQARLKANKDEIEQLEGEVRRLRDQLELRRKKQDEIIEFRLTQILREAQGLGWGTEPEMRPNGVPFGRTNFSRTTAPLHGNPVLEFPRLPDTRFAPKLDAVPAARP
jgi:hypothetical protein